MKRVLSLLLVVVIVILINTNIPFNVSASAIVGTCNMCGATITESRFSDELSDGIEASCEKGRELWYLCECLEGAIVIRSSPLGHNYVTYDEPATCTQYGHAGGSRCDRCGEIFEKSTPVNPTGIHEYEEIGFSPGDCKYPSSHGYRCKMCGDEYLEENDFSRNFDGHYDYLKPIENIPASCTSTGTTASGEYCSNCGIITIDMNFNDDMEHDYVPTSVVTETCETQGYTIYTCSDCGSKKRDDYVFPVGHDYQVKNIVNPACLTKGYTLYACSKCGKERYDDFVDVTGHNYEVSSVIKPTCTTSGYTLYVCSHCTAKKRNNYVHATGHNYEAKSVVNPTCTTPGYTNYACTDCTAIEKSSYVDATGHDYTRTVITAPTCTETGKALYTCHCEYSYTATISATGHTESDWLVIKEVTTTQTGLKVKACTVCDTVLKTKIIEKLEETAIGDIDSSGVIDVNDVTYIQNVLAGNVEATNDISIADVTGDGNITLKDATYLQLYLANLIDTFPVQK